jgi:hypothetical protein
MKFRRILSTVEAVRFVRVGNAGDMKVDPTTFGWWDSPAGPQWMIDAFVNNVLRVGPLTHEGSTLVLWCRTDHGEVVVQEGDWIICGQGGELYPINPGNLERLYQRAE